MVRFSDAEQVAWAEKQMWDNDVVEKDGKYLIFSAKDYNGVFHLEVAYRRQARGSVYTRAPHPWCSFSIDPAAYSRTMTVRSMSTSAVSGADSSSGIRLRQKLEGRRRPRSCCRQEDPALFAPADIPALSSFVVKMSEDVLQFAEAPRSVVVLDKDGQPLKAGDPHRFFEASWMHKYNGKYYFSYSTGDSHFLCYAIGDNPYGPFTYQGVLLDPVVGWTTHHSIVQYKGEWFLFYHDCVPSNDVTHLRSLKVQRLFYNEDGTIQKVINE